MKENQNNILVQLRDVKTHFPVHSGFLIEKQVGTVKAVDGVSFDIGQGEVLGLVGESGCGKSTLARTILHLIPTTAGSIIVDGKDLTKRTRQQLREDRRLFQIIFQDPYASLNPRMTVYDAIAEPILVHRLASRADIARCVAELMEWVELSPRLMRKYPHEFSGGQRQRIAIARALALQPKFIIADEPVSALDVSVQAGILNLFTRLCAEKNLTMLFISHDLAVVRHLSHRIAVMYLGRIVEIGPAQQVFENPRHPYTQALISAVPIANPEEERQRRPIVLSGDPPSPRNIPPGCPFHPRCPHADETCKQTIPHLEECGPSHSAACIKLYNLT